ncbi:MAG: FAD-dependent oxidoreductase [Candidatus Methanospirareceae archaeon]
MKGVLVIGGGIAGIQAALDLADAGIKVYMVEKEPSIGGRMAQLDKTFPTNDCSICILAPKMMECYRHPNIEIFTYSEVVSVEGEVGNFKVRVLRKPRYVDESKCTGCGDCAKVCPMGLLSEFNMNLGLRKAAYVPFMQAVPLIYVLDRDKCMRCGLCKVVCGLGAIDYEQKPRYVDLEVGAIIVATGFDYFEPQELSEYGYGKYDNVITGMQYERLICASGPTGGHLVRKDGKEVKRIAWIQCVGSRDVRAKGKAPYCCSVCCMHATKEAILAKEHYPDIETYILYTELRAFGKGFHEYVRRAKEEYGVKYIRSKPGEIKEKEDKSLVIWYDDTVTREVKSLEVDMVVLCTALFPGEDTKKIASILGIELDEYGFIKTKDEMLEPVSTSKEGIFVCGYAQSPKDIPESVAQSSGAAAKAAEVIAMYS